MSNLLDGLSEGGRTPEPMETFEDKLARAVAKTQAARGETPPPAEPTQPSAAQRDPDTGQFVSPGANTEGEETPAQSVIEGTSDDPEIAAFLAKYGATDVSVSQLPPEVQAALKAGVEATKTMGRQGQELGELRKLKEQAPAEPAAPAEAAPAPVSFPQQGELEVLEQRTEEHGWTETSQWLLQNYPDRGDLYDLHLQKAIASGDPEMAMEAFRFDQWLSAQVAAWESSQGGEGEAPAPSESGDTGDLTQEDFNVTYERVKANVPGFDALEDHFEQSLKDLPGSVREQLTSPVDAERELALYQVVGRARQLAAADGATSEEAARRNAQRVAAQVASGSLRPTGDGGGAQPTKEEAVKAFKDGIFRGEHNFDLSKGYSGL